mgnify:CR=1 FL=1
MVAEVLDRTGRDIEKKIKTELKKKFKYLSYETVDEEISNTTATVPDLKGLSISSANERAVNAGFNIKISGASLDSEVVSYRQSIDAGTQTELGATITVYFKTNKGVED